jgi:hypothetical protein
MNRQTMSGQCFRQFIEGPWGSGQAVYEKTPGFAADAAYGPGMLGFIGFMEWHGNDQGVKIYIRNQLLASFFLKMNRKKHLDFINVKY